ncbi:MAG: hypothetical protein H8E48_05745 [Chloroflexi bacterium]|nr:hypothetical protein [Chloroflexota bacterium]
MTSEALSSYELLRRASDMLPVLRERAVETENLRRIPDETISELRSSELLRIGAPRLFGGLDVGYSSMFEVGALLGSACAATSWCFCIWTAHSWLVGHWPAETQQEVFANGPDVLISSSLNPGKSTLEKTSGGFKLSGRWEFSSGSDAAGWVMVGAMGSDGLVWVLVPRSDYEIADTWFVSGLKGTGSKDIIIKDAVVPVHRILDSQLAGNGDWTGWEMHQQNRYRLPAPVLLGWDLVTPMLGITQGAIEEFTTRLAGTSGPGRTADSEGVQLRLSQSSAELDSARALMNEDIAGMFKKAQTGDAFSSMERARIRRDKAYIAQLCLSSVNRLFEFSGGHGIFESGILQRFHRDIQAAVRRDGFMMEFGGLQYARVALGLDPNGRI